MHLSRTNSAPPGLWLVARLVAAMVSAQSGAETFPERLVRAAIDRTYAEVEYDGAYYAIEYPGGDVPAGKGVCTDVVIRAYRTLGVDLQQAVHEDMLTAFAAYPSHRNWGLTRPDPNIDHRRVPNLRTFFKRHGQSIRVTINASDYRAGDLVTWILPGNLPHIGIVIDQRSTDGERPLVVHNMGAGAVVEDMLFRHPVSGHYRYADRASRH